MYAVLEISGQQFKVEKNQKIYINRQETEVESKLTFDKVLLLDDDEKVKIGTPHIENSKVEAKVISHIKGDKVIVFKKKRRKGYKKKNGHRQQYTLVQIENIIG